MNFYEEIKAVRNIREEEHNRIVNRNNFTGNTHYNNFICWKNAFGHEINETSFKVFLKEENIKLETHQKKWLLLNKFGWEEKYNGLAKGNDIISLEMLKQIWED